MQDYFLKFATEAAWTQARDAAGIEEGRTTLADGTAVDVIGTLYDQADPEAPPVAVAGFHVNLRGTLPEGWDEFQVFPETPRRIFG